jgi:hypothetical protein
LFKENGKVLIQDKKRLPPRNNIIEYDPALHAEEIERNIQWRDCPQDMQPIIWEIINKFYDMFAEDGMQKPIRGFEFNIDTGAIVPICCKPP